MNFLTFLEEKINFLIFQTSFILITCLFLGVLNIPVASILIFSGGLLIYTIIYLGMMYYKKKKKAKKIIELVDQSEEKYLISEIIKKPKELENRAYYYALKKACKSMNDKIGILEKENMDYREYVESFAHEIKTPIAALSLSFDNMKNNEMKEEIEKVNNLVEQILYYARSENTEKDYFIKEISLSEILHPIILNYKNYLLTKKIILKTENLDKIVYTDEKWLVFILSQIIQNSIKYVEGKDKRIEIIGEENNNNVVLKIIDNGCGIKKEDLPRVFEKGFTGTNRKKKNATGMGLYLSKKLCDRLGLKLEISSVEGIKTIVEITFPKSKIHKRHD